MTARAPLIAAALLLGAPVGVLAQSERTGAIVVAHGGGEEWNARVMELARSVATGGPVELAFLMGPAAATHRFQDAVARLAGQGVGAIVVVPLLVSSHSGHFDQIRYLAGELDTLSAAMMHHLHAAGIARPQVDVPLRVLPALDASPQLAAVLADRAHALADDPARQAVLLIGHGPNTSEDLAAWMARLRDIAGLVRERGGFPDVRVALIQDDAPAHVRAEAVRRARDIIELQASATARPVVVVPVLISKGALGDVRIPHDLAGLPIVYSGEPLLPHAELARWVESRVHEFRASGSGVR